LANYDQRRPFYYLATNSGRFVVYEHAHSHLHETRRENGVAKEISLRFGPVRRCLLRDYRGEKREVSSYVHHDGRYYSVYRLLSKAV
jgi:hypothetical protein